MSSASRSSFAVTVDEVTLARAKAGDEAALEALFRRFSTPVYTLARRITGSAHDAEDVLQETFLEVVRSISRFRGEGSLAGWIRKVAASKALMRLRRDGSRGAHEELPDDLPAPPAAAAGAVERVDLDAALALLSEAARAVLWLHDVEGYSHEEIAALAGRTASFSKSQLARAHARLRERLARPAVEEPCT